MSTKLKAAAYLRVSTKEQNEDTQLPDINIQALSDEAELISKYIFRDKVSGLKDKDYREGLNELLQLSNKDIDIVYIWEISRLSRDPIYFDELLNKFRKKHINICFLKPTPLYLYNLQTGDEDLTTSLALAIFSKFALFEIQQKAQRTQRGRNEAILTRNEMYACNAPFGYKKENKMLVIDNEIVSEIKGFETPAKIIKRIFEMYNAGKTPVAISRVLNEYNIKPNSHKIIKKGNIKYASGYVIDKEALLWRKNTLMGILKNTVYAGYKIVNTNIKTNQKDENGEPIIKHSENRIVTPAIISEETFNITQKQKKLNIAVANKAYKSEYLLRSLLKCHICGNYYMGTVSSNVTTYKCSDRAKKDKATYKGCTSKTINSHRLDYMVWESVKSIYKGYATLDKVRSNIEAHKTELEEFEQAISLKNNNIESKKKKIERLARSLATITSDIAANAIEKDIDSIQQEIDIQEKELHAIKMKMSDAIKNQAKIDKFRNFDYKNYDITGVENNFLLKKEAVTRVVTEVSIYETKENKAVSAIYGIDKISVIHIKLINNNDVIVYYNPRNGSYSRLSESISKFDKERVLIGMKKESTDYSFLDKSLSKQDKERLLKEININIPSDPDHIYIHPIEMYSTLKKRIIPKMEK